ncbi:hypothetical protein PLICRDRAFT_653975 [Plicaturopsis crispa FD-325 SS-3]|nr:hypothetical protein PLICRDRAFT_653975 [Plicaturopsis crispa FD-325 SS-3]
MHSNICTLKYKTHPILCPLSPAIATSFKFSPIIASDPCFSFLPRLFRVDNEEPRIAEMVHTMLQKYGISDYSKAMSTRSDPSSGLASTVGRSNLARGLIVKYSSNVSPCEVLHPKNVQGRSRQLWDINECWT